MHATFQPSYSDPFRPRADLRLLYEEQPEGDRPVKLICDLPGHQEVSPSLMVYPDHAYCFGCRTWEGWLDHCRRRGVYPDNLERPAPFSHLVVLGSQRSHARVSEAQQLTDDDLLALCQFYQERLWASDRLDWLRERGLKDETIRTYRLGHTGRAHAIPIWDGPALQTIRFRRDDQQVASGPKYWGIAGRNGTYLYCPEGFGEHMVLTEGEYDCLIAIQAGYRAFTFTNGIGSFDPSPWKDRLATIHHLVIATDQDGPGYGGAVRFAVQVRSLIPEVRIATFWEKDVTELYRARGTEGLVRVLGDA